MVIDWTDIYKQYKGLWVAMLDDEQTVVGSGETLNQALERAKRNGHDNPIVMRVPTEVMPYIGSFRL